MSLQLLQSLRESADAELCSRDLHRYTKAIWHLLEPTTPFVDNWHIGAICEHLEALYRGEIRNLLINMPPRFMKSLLIAVAYPTWIWTKDPSERMIFSSYAAQLSTRDSVKARRVIESGWYQHRYGSRFQMTSDQNVKNRYENDKTGLRIATSVDGLATGEGGNLLVCDDPHNVKDGESEAARQAALDWWDETMSTRFNDPTRGRKLVVMQRVAENDMTHHLLEKGGYVHLCIPMEFESAKRCRTVLGFVDPRTEDGELAWPKRYSRDTVEDLKHSLGSYASAAQLQQSPAPRGGGIIKRAYFPSYGTLPQHLLRISSLDAASTEKKEGATGSAFTSRLDFACDVVAGKAYLRHVYRERVAYPDLRKDTEAFLKSDDKPDILIIENKSAGIQLAQDLKVSSKRANIVLAEPLMDKITRMVLVVPECEHGRVLVPTEAEWLEAFLAEMAGFPMGKMDQIDCMSQFLHWWKAKNFGAIHAPVIANVGTRVFAKASNFHVANRANTR